MRMHASDIIAHNKRGRVVAMNYDIHDAIAGYNGKQYEYFHQIPKLPINHPHNIGIYPFFKALKAICTKCNKIPT